MPIATVSRHDVTRFNSPHQRRYADAAFEYVIYCLACYCRRKVTFSSLFRRRHAAPRCWLPRRDILSYAGYITTRRTQTPTSEWYQQHHGNLFSPCFFLRLFFFDAADAYAVVYAPRFS